MTKQDYIKLAALIKQNICVEEWEHLGKITLVRTEIINLPNFINDLCAMLKTDNPNFNVDKFRKAIS